MFYPECEMSNPTTPFHNHKLLNSSFKPVNPNGLQPGFSGGGRDIPRFRHR